MKRRTLNIDFRPNRLRKDLNLSRCDMNGNLVKPVLYMGFIHENISTINNHNGDYKSSRILNCEEVTRANTDCISVLIDLVNVCRKRISILETSLNDNP